MDTPSPESSVRIKPDRTGCEAAFPLLFMSRGIG
jgi:hypothetical protein